MLEKAVRFFGPLAAGGESPRVATVEPEQKGERRFLIREAGQTRILGLAWRSVARSDHDGYALDLLGRILGSGETSRLYHGLVESGLATDVNAGNRSWFKYPYLFEAYVTVAEGADPDSAERAVYAEIARLKSEAPSKAELARAIKQAKVETLFERDDVTSLMFSIGEAENAGNYHFYETYLDSPRQAGARRCARPPRHIWSITRAPSASISPTVRLVEAGPPTPTRSRTATAVASAPRTRSGSARPFTLDDSRAWRFDPRELEPASLVRVGPTESIPRGRSVGNALGAPSGDRTGGASGPDRTTAGQGDRGAARGLADQDHARERHRPHRAGEPREPDHRARGTARRWASHRAGGEGRGGGAGGQTLTKGTTQHSAAELAELLRSNGISLSFDAAADHISIARAAWPRTSLR
ncbi:MAG: insulinase family protein [Candidatus Eisenbacteria bacterium]